jgi:hypothetical protein
MLKHISSGNNSVGFIHHNGSTIYNGGATWEGKDQGFMEGSWKVEKTINKRHIFKPNPKRPIHN